MWLEGRFNLMSEQKESGTMNLNDRQFVKNAQKVCGGFKEGVKNEDGSWKP